MGEVVRVKSGGRAWILTGIVVPLVLAALAALWLLPTEEERQQEAQKSAGTAADGPDSRDLEFERGANARPAPEPFSKADYDRDPDGYLAQVVPGRAFQLQSPRPGLAAIARMSSTRQTVQPLESIELSVKAVAGAPVTFTSTGLGAFPNRRTSISVAADAVGVARTVFTASRGTIGNVVIFAASPMTSGQVRFNIQVAREEGGERRTGDDGSEGEHSKLVSSEKSEPEQSGTRVDKDAGTPAVHEN